MYEAVRYFRDYDHILDDDCVFEQLRKGIQGNTSSANPIL